MRNVAVAVPLFLLFVAACSSGSSTAANRCTTDAQCPAGQMCINNACQAPAVGCELDAECEGNQFCSFGECREPFNCANDVDCLGARYCRQGTCNDPCQQNGCDYTRCDQLTLGRQASK